jgi:hypothetical protein
MHELYRVTAVRLIGDYTSKVSFDDGATIVIDLEPILAGAIYGPLRHKQLFAQVAIDPEAHTLVLAQWRRLRPRDATQLGPVRSRPH